MNRKDFLKKSILGSILIGAAGSTTAKVASKPETTPVGFNHLPHTNSKVMTNSVLHKANTRGGANHGWLNAKHTFSFANYYNPDRMNFGVLRVLNDDTIAGGTGFGTHPHDNMEIITIPLEGALRHKDSLGNTAVIENGEIQVMSAGTGVFHSEHNDKQKEETKLLQIWVYPNKRNVEPRYDQIKISDNAEHNAFQQVLSPDPNDAGVWIHQDAWFHLGTFDANQKTTYNLNLKGNGVYVFIIKGGAKVNEQELETRDGYGIWDIDSFEITTTENDTQILLMEVPMQLNS